MVLASQIGYREGPNNDQEFGIWYGNPNDLWCAQFQSWGAAAAGVSTNVIVKHQSTIAGADWFRSKGQLHSVPRPGDLGYVYYPSRGKIGHVFFVEDVDSRANGSTLIQTIEGNTNDTGSRTGIGVFRLQRMVTSVLSFGRPAYTTEQEDDMQADERAALMEMRDLFRRIKAPGQVDAEGTIEATLSTVQAVFNRVGETLSAIADVKPFTIVGADDGSPERYLAVAGGLDHIEPAEFDDLVGRGAARVLLLKPDTVAMLRKPELVH